jgi:hypothetical protein
MLRSILTNALQESASTSITASWYNHPAQITHTRRFLAFLKSNTFADARPEIDAVPVTVILETHTLLRCVLPFISNTPIHTITSTTYKDCVTMGGESPHATEKPSTIPLYELLTQNIIIYWPSAKGADESKTTAPPVGYLALTRKAYGNAKASHGATQHNSTARKSMVASPYSLFLHLTSSTWKFKHLTTYASLSPATTTVCSKTQKHITLGILTQYVGTRILITM